MKHKKYSSGRIDWKTLLKKVEGVDLMFEVLEKDKRLPSFPEFFIVCLITGNAECVNLKEMFPRLYNDLSVWMRSYNVECGT